MYNKVAQNQKVPFKIENGARIEDTPVYKALREAIANCLINADYYGRQGIVIIREKNGIRLSNPGGFKIEIEAAKSGGVSDPRNTTLMKTFNMIDVGERAGSGIPNIFYVWKKQGWSDPQITELLDPERVSVSLFIGKIDHKSRRIQICNLVILRKMSRQGAERAELSCYCDYQSQTLRNGCFRFGARYKFMKLSCHLRLNF